MRKCDFKPPLLKLHFGIGFLFTNLLYIFRTPFPKNTSGGLLLDKRRISFKVDFRD